MYIRKGISVRQTIGSLKRVASVALVIVAAVLIAKLALAPLYTRYDANQCREAYARARTRADTVAVDFRPYKSPYGGRNPRCGEVRVGPGDATHIVAR